MCKLFSELPPAVKPTVAVLMNNGMEVTCRGTVDSLDAVFVVGNDHVFGYRFDMEANLVEDSNVYDLCEIVLDEAGQPIELENPIYTNFDGKKFEAAAVVIEAFFVGLGSAQRIVVFEGGNGITAANEIFT